MVLFLNKTVEGAKKIGASENCTIRGDVTRHSNSSSDIIFSWEIYEVGTDREEFSFRQQIDLGTNTITISPGQLRSGLYYLKFTALMIGKCKTTNYDFGFLQISPPPLVALVQGVNKAEKGAGSIILNASSSYDPDLQGSHSGLRFIWLCRRKNENFSNIASLPVDVAHGRDKVHGGCFGYGVGRMNSSQPVLIVDVSEMEVGHDYVFQMTLRKGDRSSVVNHNLRVESSMSFSIRSDVLNLIEFMGTELEECNSTETSKGRKERKRADKEIYKEYKVHERHRQEKTQETVQGKH